jgi:hypothetical protein
MGERRGKRREKREERREKREERRERGVFPLSLSPFSISSGVVAGSG